MIPATVVEIIHKHETFRQSVQHVCIKDIIETPNMLKGCLLNLWLFLLSLLLLSPLMISMFKTYVICQNIIIFLCVGVPSLTDTQPPTSTNTFSPFIYSLIHSFIQFSIMITYVHESPTISLDNNESWLVGPSFWFVCY